MLREPLRSSVTFLEETAPAKLPTYHGPPPGFTGEVRIQAPQEWYFTVDSPEPKSPGSQSPTYATHLWPTISGKLQ